jgi:hypothetical protein
MLRMSAQFGTAAILRAVARVARNLASVRDGEKDAD